MASYCLAILVEDFEMTVYKKIQNSMPSDFEEVFWSFPVWLSSQPEFCMESNYFSKFGKGDVTIIPAMFV